MIATNLNIIQKEVWMNTYDNVNVIFFFGHKIGTSVFPNNPHRPTCYIRNEIQLLVYLHTYIDYSLSQYIDECMITYVTREKQECEILSIPFCSFVSTQLIHGLIYMSQ